MCLEGHLKEIERKFRCARTLEGSRSIVHIHVTCVRVCVCSYSSSLSSTTSVVSTVIPHSPRVPASSSRGERGRREQMRYREEGKPSEESQR